MKKLLCTIILALAGTALFGIDFSLSAGAGGIVGGLFTRYILSANGSTEKLEATQEADQLNYGGFVFFDATYGIFCISFQNGHNTYRADLIEVGNKTTMSGKGWESMLGFSLLGKYPFRLNDRFTIFPLLGIEYQISLVQLWTDPDDGKVYRRNDDVDFFVTDWNSFFINVGGGVDFMLPKNFFLRGELLCGFRLMTPYEKKNLDTMKTLTGDSKPKLGGITVVPTFRISAGYRFYTKVKSTKSKTTDVPPTELIPELTQIPDQSQAKDPHRNSERHVPFSPEGQGVFLLPIEATIYKTRQEIIDRGFVKYDRENFEKADELTQSAHNVYKDGDKESALALAEDALLLYNDILQNGWSSYDEERETRVFRLPKGLAPKTPSGR